jgi:hypothetical protein
MAGSFGPYGYRGGAKRKGPAGRKARQKSPGRKAEKEKRRAEARLECFLCAYC